MAKPARNTQAARPLKRKQAAPAAKSRGDYRLAVDVGNTQTVVGLFDGARLLKRWRLATRKDVTVDEVALSLQGLVVPALPRSSGTPRVRAAIASVVPAQDGPWRAALTEVFGGAAHEAPRVLDHRDCGGLRLDYEVPSQIGADRLANVLGARALGIDSGVVVDFGTATTFDVFSGGAYHGGVICAGLQTGMRALAQNTARLGETELRWPEASVGRTTEEAMRVGALLGAVGAIEHLLGKILAESRLRKSPVIATGGLAHWMRGRTKALHRFEPDLTLIGINHLLSGVPPKARKAAKAPVPAKAGKPPAKKTRPRKAAGRKRA
jgi:type III pantothenate kinase